MIRNPSKLPGIKKTRGESFYSGTYEADELSGLKLQPEAREEHDLLRVKVLRLARLTPLKSLNDKELDALIKLIRVVAVMDAMERTRILALKGGAFEDPLLEALGELDPNDL